MAVTINRAPWTALVDDSGQNLDGSLWNKAAIQTVLLDPIDAALANVVTLPSTGTQTILGSVAGAVAVLAQNGSPSSVASAYIGVGNNLNAQVGYLQCFASTFGSSGSAHADGATLVGGRPGGLSLAAIDPAGALYLYTGGQVERLRVAPDGTVFVNTTTQPALGRLVLAANGAANQALVVQNNNAANTSLYFVYCLNSAAGACGGIAQAGATSVVFNTTSDARLKTDAGPATDLTALRAVRVHDFTWMADGVRDRGLFAQEAHALYPRAVTPGTDARTAAGALAQPWQTDYSKFVPDLIVGWQQHEAALAELRAALARRVA